MSTHLGLLGSQALSSPKGNKSSGGLLRILKLNMHRLDHTFIGHSGASSTLSGIAPAGRSALCSRQHARHEDIRPSDSCGL